MHSSKSDLIRAVDKISSATIMVIGDLILDRYIWGQVERISPEAPVPVVAVKKSEDRLGGAANVARNLRSVGVHTHLCGFVGEDEEGQTALRIMKEDRIGHEGVMVNASNPTTVKTRVIAHAQQVVRIDRESNGTIPTALNDGFANLVDACLDKTQAIIVSDYGKGCISETIIKKLALARKAGRIGLNIRPLVVDPHPSHYAIYDEMCVVKPNRKEAEIASQIKIVDRESAAKAAAVLAKKWKSKIVLITLGEDGLLLYLSDTKKPVFLETLAQEVYDVSGAGDTVTALFSAALGAGVDPIVAGELANIGAGIVVSEVGTVAVGKERLLSKIEELE